MPLNKNLLNGWGAPSILMECGVWNIKDLFGELRGKW